MTTVNIQPSSKPRKPRLFFGIDWLFLFLALTYAFFLVAEIKFKNGEAAWAWLNLLTIETWFWHCARQWRKERKELTDLLDDRPSLPRPKPRMRTFMFVFYTSGHKGDKTCERYLNLEAEAVRVSTTIINMAKDHITKTLKEQEPDIEYERPLLLNVFEVEDNNN